MGSFISLKHFSFLLSSFLFSCLSGETIHKIAKWMDHKGARYYQIDWETPTQLDVISLIKEGVGGY